MVGQLGACTLADPISTDSNREGYRDAGREYNWLEQGRTMYWAGWAGLIVGLIVGVLVMYGVWLLVRSLED